MFSREKHISFRDFRTIFSQVCDALQFASSGGILHRDVKPSNIMICEEAGQKKVVVFDFGIAKILDEDPEKTVTCSDALMGSPLYMSPEQCRGELLDLRTDVYSLGCVMYEALAGVPPFCGQTPMEIMYKHMNEVPPKLGVITQSGNQSAALLSELIEKCLKKSPAERPPDFESIKKAINGAAMSGTAVFRRSIENNKMSPKTSVRNVVFGMSLIASVAVLLGLTCGSRFVDSKAPLTSSAGSLDYLESQTARTMRLFRSEQTSDVDRESRRRVLMANLPNIAKRASAEGRYELAEHSMKDFLSICPKNSAGASVESMKAHMQLGDIYCRFAGATEDKNKKARLVLLAREQLETALRESELLGLKDYHSFLLSLLVRSYCENGEIQNSKAVFQQFMVSLRELNGAKPVQFLYLDAPSDCRVDYCLGLVDGLCASGKPKVPQDYQTLSFYCLSIGEFLVSIHATEESTRIFEAAEVYLRHGWPDASDPSRKLQQARIDDLRKKLQAKEG